MATAFGPQGPNFTTTRPAADAQASGGLDTWFKNCSAAGAKDGTYATADFFNVIIANLRNAVGQSGVPLSDAEDTMLYDAIKSIADKEISDNAGYTAGGGIGISTTRQIALLLGTGTLPLLT